MASPFDNVIKILNGGVTCDRDSGERNTRDGGKSEVMKMLLRWNFDGVPLVEPSTVNTIESHT